MRAGASHGWRTIARKVLRPGPPANDDLKTGERQRFRDFLARPVDHEDFASRPQRFFVFHMPMRPRVWVGRVLVLVCADTQKGDAGVTPTGPRQR